MNITAVAEGSLLGEIAILRLEDAEPSLAYKIHIPVSFQGQDSTLSIDLLHPEVRSWRGLIDRSYLFNESTERQGMADGQTYIYDDVFGDLRTETGYYDTFITKVQFGSEANGRIDMEVQGTLRLEEASVAFTVSAKVKVEGVILDAEFKDLAPTLLNLQHYHP